MLPLKQCFYTKICLLETYCKGDLLQKKGIWLYFSFSNLLINICSRNTIWQNTPLVEAIIKGRLTILDGLHRLPSGTVSVLFRYLFSYYLFVKLICVNRLIQDREITLFDGTRFVRHDRYQHMITHLHLSKEQLQARRIFPVHLHFRIIAIATPPTINDPWLTNETIHLFDFHPIPQFGHSLSGPANAVSVLDTPTPNHPPTPTPTPSTSSDSLISFLQTVAPGAPQEILVKLQNLHERMLQLCSDPVIQLDAPISLRQLIRVAKRAARYPDEVAQNLVSIYTSVYLYYCF